MTVDSMLDSGLVDSDALDLLVDDSEGVVPKTKKGKGGRPSRAEPGATRGRPVVTARMKELWRQFCHKTLNNKGVRQRMLAEALLDPKFALRLADYCYGKPHQAVEVKQKVEVEHKTRTVTLEGGEPLFAPTPAVPDVGIN